MTTNTDIVIKNLKIKLIGKDNLFLDDMIKYLKQVYKDIDNEKKTRTFSI